MGKAENFAAGAKSLLWVKIVAAFLASVSLAAAFCATEAAGAADREALWGVVRACVSTHELTGASFPCLSVDVSEGEERGFVVLRPPFGAPDTILAPTRKIAGVEDPWLMSPEAPNYFAAAWKALPFSMADGSDEGREQGAVAINSKAGRSQDQLHIHMGCLAPGAGKFLAEFSAQARIGEWTRLPAPHLGGDYWLLRTGKESLANVQPFRLVAGGPAATPRDRAQTMIAVAKPRIGTRREFVVLAARSAALTAEQVVDVACARSH